MVPLAATMQSDISTAFSQGSAEFDSPKCSVLQSYELLDDSLHMILEKGESKYDYDGATIEKEKEMPAHEKIERLLDQLTLKSAKLADEAMRLTVISSEAASTSRICDEVDEMIDNYISANERILSDCINKLQVNSQ